MLRRLALLAIVATAAPAAARRGGHQASVASGGWYAPRFSPDGTELLVTGLGYRGLALLPVDGGAARQIVDDEAAGVDARFLADGRIAFRARRAGARRELIADRDGAVRSAAPAAPLAWAQGDRIYVRAPAGGVVSPGTGDRFFAPLPSPDGSRVAFIGLETGIHVHDLATGTTTHVGAGTAPAWSPDGSWLVFERTEDDGHDIVASDLWTWRPDAGAARLTFTDELERRPSVSPDGWRIAFDDDAGAIHLLEMAP